MRRRRFLGVAGTLAAAGLSGCTAASLGAPEAGDLQVSVAGHAASVEPLAECRLAVSALTAGPADGEPLRRGGLGASVDLTADATTVGPVEVDAGQYRTVGLQIDGATARLAGGGEATVEVPDGPLEFQRSFEVRGGRSTTVEVTVAPVEEADGRFVLRQGYLANCWCS